MLNNKKYSLTVFGENFTIATDEPVELMHKTLTNIEILHKSLIGKCEKNSRSLILLVLQLAKEAVLQEEQLKEINKKIDLSLF